MRISLLVFVLLGLAACGGPSGAPLRVEPGQVAVEPGGRVTLEALGGPANLEWVVAKGSLQVDGRTATYTAPPYATDDEVVVRGGDSEVRVSVLVRPQGAMGPRLVITGERALVFTRVGETRVFTVEVYDVFGEPVPDARVEFVSDDPARFRVESTGPKTARVTALTGELGTVRLRARYQGAEAWAHAVYAELQPYAQRLDPAWVLEAEWSEATMSWTRVVLKRTPETEALEAGQTFFTDDRTGLWGRIEAVRLQNDRVEVDLSKAAMTQIFRRLSYSAVTPRYRVEATVVPGGAGFLRVLGEDGSERIVPLSACQVSTGVEIEEPRIDHVFEVWVETELELEPGFSLEAVLDRAAFVLHSEAGLEASGGRISYRAGDATIDCTLGSWDVSIPTVSVLILTLNVDLFPAVGLYATLADSDSRVEVAGPSARAVASAAIGFRYTDAGGWQFVDEFGTDVGLRGPSFGITAGRMRSELGPWAELELGLSINAELIFETVTLLGGRFLEFVGELPLYLTVTSADVRRASYTGPDWGFGWRLRGFLKLELYGVLAEFLTELFGSGATYLGSTELFNVGDPRAFLGPPAVSSSLSTSHLFGVDLGDTSRTPQIEFTATPAGARTEFWRQGGRCATSADCFGATPLIKLGETSTGRWVWRPGKADVGWYLFYARHYTGPIGQVLPHASQPSPLAVYVASPNLDFVPSGVLLKGKVGGNATGVLRYYNRPQPAVLPNGTTADVTSLLRTLVPAVGAVAPDPTTAAIYSGRWAYHQLSYACPASPTTVNTSVFLFTNDPDSPAGGHQIPVTVECTNNSPPQAYMQWYNLVGPAPLTTTFQTSAYDPDGDPMGCYLDFGDGSPRVEYALGQCPAGFTVDHTYTEPGTYQASFVVTDVDGERDVFTLTVEAQ